MKLFILWLVVTIVSVIIWMNGYLQIIPIYALLITAFTIYLRKRK